MNQTSRGAPTTDQMSQQLLEFARMLQGRFQRAEVISAALERCKEMMNARAVAIFLVEPSPASGSPRLVMADCRGYDRVSGLDTTNIGALRQRKARLKRFTYDLDETLDEGYGLTAQIALKKESVLINCRKDFESEEGHQGKYDADYWYDPETCKSFVGVPLIFSTECIGVLKVEKDQERFYSKDHKNHIQILGLMVAVAISSCQFFDSLGRATKTLAVSRPDAEILQGIVTECANLCHAEACSLFLYDEEIKGLIMRADHGHDHNLSNMSGPNNEGRAFIYAGKQRPYGLTWKCYDERQPQEASTKDEVTKTDQHANKIWPRQWKEHDKVCHSIYLHPVMEEETARKRGVLKVENKLGISQKPVETGGFTSQDKSAIALFADVIALLLRDASGYLGDSYTPAEIFGEPILRTIRDESFATALSDLKRGEDLCERLRAFAEGFDTRMSDRLTIAQYSSEVTDNALLIAKILDCEPVARSVLGGLRDYEILLNQIPAYRHHFVHQFNVFLLGLVVLAGFDPVRHQVLTQLGKDKVLREWFLAAMFHDIGLPVEKWAQVFQVFLKKSLHLSEAPAVALPPFSIMSVYDYLSGWKAIADCAATLFQNELVRSKMLTVLHSFAVPSEGDVTCHNHSVVSAAMLESHWDALGLSRESRRRILSSILFHERRVPEALFARLNDSEEEEARCEISLSANPLMFLLGLCDTIQNWGRPESGGDTRHSGLDESGRVVLDRLEFRKQEMKVYLKYPKEPEDWENVLQNVLRPQAAIWRNNIERPEINVHFQTKGRDIGQVSFPYVQDATASKG